jgi:hypothetical protein
MTQSVPRGELRPSALLDPTFWENAFHQATGTGFSFRFGTSLDDFLLGPWLQGRATRLVLTLQAICSIIGIAAIVGAAEKFAARLRQDGPRSALLSASRPDEALLLTGGFAGFGLLLTLSGFRLYPHYLLAAFPLIPLALVLALWSPTKIRRNRLVLATLVISQLVTSVLLREHLHQTGGSPQSDHGVVFSRQHR